MFSIGQLSDRSGIKVPTLRYYEEIGLIEPPHRSEGNQRRYEPLTLERVNFIRHGRDLGFSIDAIRELITLSKSPEMSCTDAHEIANAHLLEIQQKIERLRNLQLELDRIASLGDKGTIGECKILEALNDHKYCQTEHER